NRSQISVDRRYPSPNGSLSNGPDLNKGGQAPPWYLARIVRISIGDRKTTPFGFCRGHDPQQEVNDMRLATEGNWKRAEAKNHRPHGVPSRKRRIALYSHDTMGVGHIRRNLTIAKAFANALPQAVTLLIAGVHELSTFGLPRGVDCLTLPSLFKQEDGTYR